MKLYELAYGCRIYRDIAGYDDTYNEMRNELGPAPNLVSHEQRDALMKFLNRWGCRIPKKNFPSLKDRLKEWAVYWIQKLSGSGEDIRCLTDAQRAQVGDSYSALLTLGSGLHFQNTAAAKTLHAVRPDPLPIWDNTIQDWFSQKASAKGVSGQVYSEFLRQVAEEISELEQDVKRLNRSLSLNYSLSLSAHAQKGLGNYL